MTMTSIHDLVAPRTCTKCKEGMWDGYCIDGGAAYYCSDKCLHTVFTAEEWEEYYDEDGDSYYTEWEEGDLDEDTIIEKLEELANISRITLTEHQESILDEQVKELERVLADLVAMDERMAELLKRAR